MERAFNRALFLSLLQSVEQNFWLTFSGQGSNHRQPRGLRRSGGTRCPAETLSLLIDPIEDILAPAVIERAMSIFESFKERDRADRVQARKAVTEHVFGLIAAGQNDEQLLVVSALTFLKSLEERAAKS